MSEDGLTFTFNLRESVKFHNGKEMRANSNMIQVVNAVIDVETVMLASFADVELYELDHSYMNLEQVTWEATVSFNAIIKKQII